MSVNYRSEVKEPVRNESVEQQLRNRSDVPEAYRWKLEDLYASDQDWEDEYGRIEAMIPRLGEFQGTLGQSAARLAECFRVRDEVSQRLERLMVYAITRRDEDSTVASYQAMFDRAQRLSVAYATAASFIEPEIVQLPRETLDAYGRAEELALYRHHLDTIIRLKPHSLTPAEEAILAAAGEMARAPANVFGMFNNADLKFPTVKDEQGRDVEVTHGRYIRLLESPDRRVRRDAFRAVHGTYAQWRHTVAAMLSASVRNNVFYARMRRYPSALHAALYGDAIPVEVYTNLIDTVRSRLSLLHRYVRLRRRLLGLDELHMYDLHVPLVQQTDVTVPYERAADMLLESLKPLGSHYADTVAEGLRSRWVDVFENRGKRSGAYSISAYGVHPYILMNYEPNLDNVFTLAHEFGHALHSHLANEAQPYVYANYTIFVAEVASTLNEHLLFHHLLKTTTSPDARRLIINKHLDTIRTTVFRQVKFAEFEKLIHERVESGGALTADWMSDTYYRLVQDYFGPDAVADEEIAIEWARIPHFYHAFYVYQYATGFAAATALGQAILEEGAPAVERYVGMLRRGGADYPLNLLKEAGVDMTAPAPILRVMDLFEELMNELEELG